MNRSIIKYIILIIAIILSIRVGIFIVNFYHSIQLINAIDEQNIERIEKIIQKDSKCINIFPSLLTPRLNGVIDLRVMYPLNKACTTGNIELVQALVEAGADVNCNDGLTPLSITFTGKKDNWYEIAWYLIDNGASLNYRTEYSGGFTSVLYDIVQPKSGSALPDYIPEKYDEVYAVFRYAVKNCDKDSVDWQRVFCECASIGSSRIEIMKYLLDEGLCTADYGFSGDMTPLMFAARDSDKETVQFLLDCEVNKDYVDEDGMTALDYAINFDNFEVVGILKD